MARTLQIRDVPDEVHAAVRARAAGAGLSVSDYLRRLITELATGPTMEEVVERARVLSRSGGGASAEDALAAVRSSRER